MICKGCFRRFDQITTHFLINMAFAAYLLENAIWYFPGVGYLHTFLSLTVGFLYEPPGPNVRHFQLFKNKNGTEMLDKCLGVGGGEAGVGTLRID